MSSRTHVSVIVALSLMTSLPVAAQTAPAPGASESTGTKIGTIISAAVTTAFPAVKVITDLIWPAKDGARNTDSVKADAAAKSLKPAADAAANKQATYGTTLATTAKDLIVLRAFVTGCGTASMRLAAMQRLLAAEPKPPATTLSDKVKNDLRAEWNVAKGRLDPLTTDAVSAQVDSMSDVFLRSTVGAIRDSIRDTRDNIKMQIDNGNAAALRESLATLTPQIASVAPLAGVLIGDLSTSLAKAAADFKLAAGPGLTEAARGAAAADRQLNVSALKEIYGNRVKLP